MSDPFVAEIRIFAGNFPPRGWATCDGQLLPIAQNTALFSLLGTTYGGDGKTSFALPQLGGRSPLGAGQGPGLSPRGLGESGGSAEVTLDTSQMPAHGHALQAALSPSSSMPGPDLALAPVAGGAPAYRASGTPQAMAPQTLAAAGGGQPHNNLQPYLGLTFIIALQGIYPARS